MRHGRTKSAVGAGNVREATAVTHVINVTAVERRDRMVQDVASRMKKARTFRNWNAVRVMAGVQQRRGTNGQELGRRTGLAQRRATGQEEGTYGT